MKMDIGQEHNVTSDTDINAIMNKQSKNDNGVNAVR